MRVLLRLHRLHELPAGADTGWGRGVPGGPRGVLRAEGLFHGGDCYKRPRYGHRSPEEQLWLERRGISFTADSHDFPLLFSPQLPEKLAQDMRLLFPVYRFLESTAQEVLRRETEQGLWQR